MPSVPRCPTRASDRLGHFPLNKSHQGQMPTLKRPISLWPLGGKWRNSGAAERGGRRHGRRIMRDPQRGAANVSARRQLPRDAGLGNGGAPGGACFCRRATHRAQRRTPSSRAAGGGSCHRTGSRSPCCAGGGTGRLNKCREPGTCVPGPTADWRETTPGRPERIEHSGAQVRQSRVLRGGEVAAHAPGPRLRWPRSPDCARELPGALRAAGGGAVQLPSGRARSNRRVRHGEPATPRPPPDLSASPGGSRGAGDAAYLPS